MVCVCVWQPSPTLCKGGSIELCVSVCAVHGTLARLLGVRQDDKFASYHDMRTMIVSFSESPLKAARST
jgi:hypothetical protein